MIRMKDIAESCGVSRTTVSLALNDRYGGNVNLSETLRSKIKTAARKMGYQPNRNAVALSKGRNPAIGIFLPPFRSELVVDIIFGMSDFAMHNHYPVFLSSGYTDDIFIQFLENSKKMSSSGIIIYFNFNDTIYNTDFRNKIQNMIRNGELEDSPYHEVAINNEKFYRTINDYISSGGKVVLLNEVPEIYKSATSPIKYVACDDIAGGKMAAEHFIKRGCKTFYAISSYPRCYLDRLNGYKTTLQNAGKECISFEILNVNTNSQNRQMLKDILDQIKTDKLPLGLFVPTDFTAIPIYEYFKSKGLEIGKDIKIIGYDDSECAKFMVPGLTSLQQNFNKAGTLAMQTLISMLANLKVKSQMIKPKLIIRQST